MLYLRTWACAASLVAALTAAAFASAAPLRPAHAARAADAAGSSNVVTADPPVLRPGTTPCYVPLFTTYTFSTYAAQGFPYAPPARCPGPWAKVVFEGDFTVSAGRQFDRTADVWIGNANVFFGTTPEPRKALAPSWHVERDVTELSALLRSPQPGEVEIFQVVNATYTGIIRGSSRLAFYPANAANRAPRTPDVVVPLSGGYGGELVPVTAATALAQSVRLPRNVEKLELDVFAQSQSGDEFWYTCTSNDLAPYSGCGDTAFRETEIAVDGKPAGVAPVYPWIYTGGIDPYLWEPIPGVQTLNFRPYRVDLTPFAALLDDGKAHAISIGVYNALSYFSVAGTLLAYEDRRAAAVTGSLTTDTLQAQPSPVLVENVANAATAPAGTESVTSSRRFVIAGFVDTSHGRVETKIEQDVEFANVQRLQYLPSLQIQDVAQRSNVRSRTTTRDAAGVRTADSWLSYPLALDTSATIAGSLYTLSTHVRQGLEERHSEGGSGATASAERTADFVRAQDTLLYDLQQGVVTGHHGAMSEQTYRSFDSRGRCYARTLVALENRLRTDASGCLR